ncbi:flavin reductase family protein [Streptomyces sp. NPDC006372]|uniref:flavin reductase family protein n=1 Tax=Streptomyces sp. NPDC006372 TaxID=3155599 RepID=UPI0033B65F69
MTLQPQMVAPAEFRSLMSQFPTGVTIVTTTNERRQPRGMTCSSLCSLTLQPPTLLVCLRSQSPTLETLLARGSFAVNFLHSEARAAAELFGSGAPDRFDQVPWVPGPAGPHLTEHSHAVADCQVSDTAEGGSHTVVFGRISAISQRAGLTPLLYGRRTFLPWPQ